MSRFKKFDVDPVDVDADGLAQSQTPSGAGALTLNGALISGGVYTAGDGDGVARQISVTSASDDSARTLTITGTDADGRTQTEAISVGNATTVESGKYWATVTEASIDAAAAGALTVGTVDECCTKTYPLNRYGEEAALLQLDVTGTIDVTVQVTLENVQQTFTDQESIPWISTQDTDLVTATADAIGSLDLGASAFRLVVNSHSSGGEVQAYIRENT